MARLSIGYQKYISNLTQLSDTGWWPSALNVSQMINRSITPVPVGSQQLSNTVRSRMGDRLELTSLTAGPANTETDSSIDSFYWQYAETRRLCVFQGPSQRAVLSIPNVTAATQTSFHQSKRFGRKIYWPI